MKIKQVKNDERFPIHRVYQDITIYENGYFVLHIPMIYFQNKFIVKGKKLNTIV